MRDPERIKRILHLIKRIWVKCPDLRLCQLIGNCTADFDMYYVEDDKLEERLQKIYSKVINDCETKSKPKSATSVKWNAGNCLKDSVRIPEGASPIRNRGDKMEIKSFSIGWICGTLATLIIRSIMVAIVGSV